MRSFRCQRAMCVTIAPSDKLEVIRYKALVAEKYAGPSCSYLTGSNLPSVRRAV